MIFGLFKRRNTNRAIVDRQYETLTATARIPFFYSDLGVPDTVMGRFEMLSVIMILYLRRIGRRQSAGHQIGQEIVDAFFQDVDHSIRELGVGDQGVPKRMKKLAGMFYGRLETYSKALKAADVGELGLALRRNIHPADEAGCEMAGLAAWMIEAERQLTAAPEEWISRGDIKMPVPGI